MDNSIPLPLIQTLAAEKGVTKAELEVLVAALNGKPYQEIADSLRVKDTAVRKRLGEVYRKFGLPKGGGPGKLTKLEQLLRELGAVNSTAISHEPSRLPNPQIPDLGMPFYGRKNELQVLKSGILSENLRLIAVIGVGGVGKTALISHLLPQIDTQFQGVVWRSLTSAPPIEHLLRDVIQEIGIKSTSEEDVDSLETRIDQFLSVLRQNRYLIILDDFEAVLREQDFYGRYKQGADDYGTLLSEIAKKSHDSCVILCSQAPPREIKVLDSADGPVRKMDLDGLELEEAKLLLQEKQLRGEAAWSALIDMYRGNPLALQTISQTIQNILGGDVQAFMQLGTTTINGGYLQKLEEHFAQLSVYEKEIVKCLANPELKHALSFQALLKQVHSMMNTSEELKSMLSSSDLIVALELLEERSLVEKNRDNQFSLLPAFKRYIQKHHISLSG